MDRERSGCDANITKYNLAEARPTELQSRTIRGDLIAWGKSYVLVPHLAQLMEAAPGGV